MNAEGLEETAQQVKALGRRAHVVATDLANSLNCSTAVASAAEAFGRLDALCNVAGILIVAHATEMSKPQWDKIIGVNLAAPFHLIQAAIPHLLKTNGAVVNVTSQAAFIGQAYMAAYCATKAGLTHMTKALAVEYTRQPIRFNAVAPGGMMTPMGSTIQMPENIDAELWKRVFAMRGIVEVEDVAELVAFLATPASRGYSGACICLDNGVTIG